MKADICLLCEGSYPYNFGGVSQWTHELIEEHKDKTFHILTLMPQNSDLKMHYNLPENVVGHSVWIVQHMPKGSYNFRSPKETWTIIEKMIRGIISSKNFDGFDESLAFFRKHEKILGKKILFESEDAWNFMLNVYDKEIPTGPFKAYFATIVTLCRSLFSIMLPKLPEAKIFHSVCTGYAGFILYRAKKELNAPCLLTEHGVYSNERRIEVAMADWIAELSSLDLNLEDKKRSLKDFWLNAFLSMAYVCYKNCDAIYSTYDGNQETQREGGADPAKMRTIVHGIHLHQYEGIKKARPKKERKSVAFVGRIVPIKDVKTYIRACQIIHDNMPEVELLAIGPTEEDPQYFHECKNLSIALGLENVLTFTGRMQKLDILKKIDLLVLTSISEAQPLVILEAGAVGIPSVATNIGGCSQLLYGSQEEEPPLGPGGIITPLVNPDATAAAVLQLLKDADFYEKCSISIQKRVENYYRFEQESKSYRDTYDHYLRH